MKKKIFSLFIVILILCSLFVTVVSANTATDITSGGEPFHVESQVCWSLLYEAYDSSSESPKRALNYADFSSFYCNNSFLNDASTTGEESIISYGNHESTLLISYIRSYDLNNSIYRTRNSFTVAEDGVGGVYLNSLRVYSYNSIKPERSSADKQAKNPFPVFIYYGSALSDFGYVSSSIQCSITQFVDGVKYEYWIDEDDIFSLVTYGYNIQVSSDQYYVAFDLNNIILGWIDNNYPDNNFDISKRFMVNYLDFKPFDYDNDILVNGDKRINFISQLPLSRSSAIDELNAFMSEFQSSTYQDGFRDGQIDGMSINSIPKFLDSVVEPFFTTELFPGFSIGGLLSVILGALLTIWILRLIAGG